jgi:hypothetical protein
MGVRLIRVEGIKAEAERLDKWAKSLNGEKALEKRHLLSRTVERVYRFTNSNFGQEFVDGLYDNFGDSVWIRAE